MAIKGTFIVFIFLLSDCLPVFLQQQILMEFIKHTYTASDLFFVSCCVEDAVEFYGCSNVFSQYEPMSVFCFPCESEILPLPSMSWFNHGQQCSNHKHLLRAMIGNPHVCKVETVGSTFHCQWFDHSWLCSISQAFTDSHGDFKSFPLQAMPIMV